MQTFDDKTAPHQIPFEAYGTEVRICTNSPELLALIEPMIPPGSRRRPRSATQRRVGLLAEGDDAYAVYRDDGACIHESSSLDYALLMVETQIHGLVALDSPKFVFIHAGVVADNGRAIVMPGLSFGGKTTLVTALVRAGALYYSDEFAVLDESGRVHPYPRPLTLRTPTEPRITEREATIEELGGTAGAAPVQVGLVISTHFRPGTDWDPEELSPGAGALAVFEHAVPARDRPEQTLQVIKRALDGAIILRGDRGEADEVAGLLLDALRAAA